MEVLLIIGITHHISLAQVEMPLQYKAEATWASTVTKYKVAIYSW